MRVYDHAHLSIISKKRRSDMKTKQIKEFMQKDIATVSCHGKTHAITGACLTAAVLLVAMHVVMIKCISLKIGRLKERAGQSNPTAGSNSACP